MSVRERRDEVSEDGRSFTLQPSGLTALNALGVLSDVLERGQRMHSVVFRRPDGRELARYDYREIGGEIVEIRPGELRRVLADELGRRGGELRTGAPVELLDDIEADLIVGADGIGSRVRELLGIGTRRFPARRDEYVLGTVDTLVEPDHMSVYCGRGFGDGIAPIPGATYFWDRLTDENRAAVEARDLEAWRAVYAERVAGAANVPAAITSWSQLTRIRIEPFWARANRSGRALLVGDAAGAVHPHIAQGANLALEDASALGAAESSDAGLAAYARERAKRRRRFVLLSLYAAVGTDAPSLFWAAVQRSNLAGTRVGPLRRQALKRVAGCQST